MATRTRRRWRRRVRPRGRDPREGVRRSTDAAPGRLPRSVQGVGDPRARPASRDVARADRPADHREVHRRHGHHPGGQRRGRPRRGVHASCAARRPVSRGPDRGRGASLRPDAAHHVGGAARDVRPAPGAVPSSAVPVALVLRPQSRRPAHDAHHERHRRPDRDGHPWRRLDLRRRGDAGPDLDRDAAARLASGAPDLRLASDPDRDHRVLPRHDARLVPLDPHPSGAGQRLSQRDAVGHGDRAALHAREADVRPVRGPQPGSSRGEPGSGTRDERVPADRELHARRDLSGACSSSVRTGSSRTR